MTAREIGSGLVVGAGVGMAVLLQLGFATPARAISSDAPVTQEQFREWTNWAAKSVKILNARQKKLEADASSKSGSDQVVDLNNLGATPTSQTNLGVGEGSGKNTKMETYFDLNLINQPGTPNALAFDNYHSFVFFNIMPSPDLTFSFNLLGPQVYPLYYELDYSASKHLTLRAGKIWIPFDDLSPQSPHNIFGGRAGIRQLMPSASSNMGQQFLPSVWTELGIGAKYLLVDTRDLQLETHLCIVDGFTDGGQDPVNGSTDYPNFTEYSPNTSSNQGAFPSGNHRDKAIATRAHALISNTFGVGISYYTGQWNQDSDPVGHLRLSMIGSDMQLMVAGLEFRGGVTSMSVDLPGTSMHRGGTYGEMGIPLNARWKALVRGGTLQLDSRITLPTDEKIVGGTILYNPGNVQFSLEHSRDIANPGVSVGFMSYTDLRMIMLF